MILTYKRYRHNTHFLLLKFISDTSSYLSDRCKFLGWTLYHHFAFMYCFLQPADRRPFLSIWLVYLASHGIVEKNDLWKGYILLSTFPHILLKSCVNDLAFTFQLFLDTIMPKNFIRKNISWSFRLILQLAHIWSSPESSSTFKEIFHSSVIAANRSCIFQCCFIFCKLSSYKHFSLSVKSASRPILNFKLQTWI